MASVWVLSLYDSIKVLEVSDRQNWGLNAITPCLDMLKTEGKKNGEKIWPSKEEKKKLGTDAANKRKSISPQPNNCHHDYTCVERLSFGDQ